MKRSRTLLTVLALAAVLSVTLGAMAQTTQPSGRQPEVTNAPTNQPAPAANAPANPQNAPASKPGGGGGGGGFEGMPMLILLLGGFLLLMWWSSRGRKKQEAKHREMLAALKKGDKVTTIGGMVGTIVEVREDEVTLKVDENTRIKFTRWAIRGVGEESKTQGPDDKK